MHQLHRVNKVYFVYKIAFIVTALLLLTGLPVLAGLDTLPPFIELAPYKVKERELNLWRIEDTHFKRSTPALAPDGSGMAYSEAVYEPSARQIFSRLYWVPFEGIGSWDPESPANDPAAANPELWLSFLDPNKSLQLRVMLGQTGDDTRRGFGFQTLTVVDWSADSQQLLLKRRVGLMYTGLRTSETLVFNKHTGQLSNYRELQRAVHYYWAKQLKDEKLPLFQAAWSIEPIGWEIGSSNRFYFEGWAYQQNERKDYLGLWLYDLKLQHPRLISPIQQSLPLAYNAKIATLNVEELSEPYKKQWQGLASQPNEPNLWKQVGLTGTPDDALTVFNWYKEHKRKEEERRQQRLKRLKKLLHPTIPVVPTEPNIYSIQNQVEVPEPSFQPQVLMKQTTEIIKQQTSSPANSNTVSTEGIKRPWWKRQAKNGL